MFSKTATTFEISGLGGGAGGDGGGDGGGVLSMAGGGVGAATAPKKICSRTSDIEGQKHKDAREVHSLLRHAHPPLSCSAHVGTREQTRRRKICCRR